MKTAAGLKYLFTAVGLRPTITRHRLHKYFLLPLKKLALSPVFYFFQYPSVLIPTRYHSDTDRISYIFQIELGFINSILSLFCCVCISRNHRIPFFKFNTCKIYLYSTIVHFVISVLLTVVTSCITPRNVLV